jgi:nucleoside-diphosphate-sugar epimerase
MIPLSIFGGTGFVGSNFVRLYGPTNIHVRERWNRRPIADTDTLFLISTVHNYNVFEDATLDVKTNLLTLTETLESFRHNTPDRIFNFVSSWFVYGDHGGYPVPEHVSCYPKGFYSITKKCAEDLVKSYCETFDLQYRILRLCNVVGPGDHFNSKKNALQWMIQKMKEGKPIGLYEDGMFYRNYMHVEDVCAAMKLVMKLPLSQYWTYNIGHPEHRLFRDHVMKAADLIGYDKNLITTIPATPFHNQIQTTSFKMDTTKLQNNGFKPVYNLDQMIEAIVPK